MNTLKKLYEGNMRKNYFSFALPLIFSALLSQSYGFINSMMIGEYLGSTAFAATAVTTLFLTFVNTFLTGYHQGSSIYFSVLFGKNENGKMLNAIKSNFIITTAFAFLIPLICNLFAPQIFKILNVNNEVYKNAMLYFRIYVFAYPTLQFVWGFPGVARAMGETKMPLVASAISGIFNVFFNFLFLKVMHKGIHYCAISTIFSTSIITVFYILTFMRLFKREGIISKGVKFRKDEIKALVKIPLSGDGLNGTTFSLTTTGGCLLASLVFGHFGRIGKLNIMPSVTTLKVFRELGLVLFLAGAGVSGGARFVQEFKIDYFVYGVIMTIVPMIIGFIFAKYVLKINILNILGSITGGMTSTPALGTLIHVAGTEDVAAAYAATYPIALVAVVFASQFIIILF